MAELANSIKLWTVNRHGTALALAASATGLPEPIQPAPMLFKAAYVGPSASESDLAYARQGLNSPTAPLLARMPSPDGPPAQTALLFSKIKEEPVTYVIGSRSFHSIPATWYMAIGPAEGYGWESDLHQGRKGYFLVGSADEANLWRIVRTEIDFAARRTFTLSPVALAHGLPVADFSLITDADILNETERNWHDLGHALVGNRSVAAVTSAKQVAENLLTFMLIRDGHIKTGNQEFNTLLKKLAALLEDRAPQKHQPFSYLDYHLMQKMRLLHGGTHIGRTLDKGRAVSPELGLTVATDLVEVLRSVGIVA